MSDVTELAQRMKAAALKATEGPWIIFDDDWSDDEDAVITNEARDDACAPPILVIKGGGSESCTNSPFYAEQRANAEHLATSCPENVLALVEALEARDLTLSARDYHYDQQADLIQSLEKALEAAAQNSDGVAGMAEHYETTISMLKSRIAELEARTVKLPATKFCPAEYAGSQLWEEVEIWNKAIEACDAAIRAAGVAVEGE